jgi:hypothetical protein
LWLKQKSSRWDLLISTSLPPALRHWLGKQLCAAAVAPENVLAASLQADALHLESARDESVSCAPGWAG